MANVSFLGIPHDANSSYMKGAAEVPSLIRAEMGTFLISQQHFAVAIRSVSNHCTTSRPIDAATSDGSIDSCTGLLPRP